MLNPVQGIPVIPGDPSTWPPPRQRKHKVLATPDEQGKAHATEQGNDGGDEAWLPQTELEVERADLNFLCYIQPRRPGVVEVDLSKKVMTTLIAPRIPIGMTSLQDILPKLDVLKFQGYDTQQ